MLNQTSPATVAGAQQSLATDHVTVTHSLPSFRPPFLCRELIKKMIHNLAQNVNELPASSCQNNQAVQHHSGCSCDTPISLQLALSYDNDAPRTRGCVVPNLVSTRLVLSRQPNRGGPMQRRTDMHGCSAASRPQTSRKKSCRAIHSYKTSMYFRLYLGSTYKGSPL